MQDITLRQIILDELEFELSIDAANIGVAVDDGIVTLVRASKLNSASRRFPALAVDTSSS